MRFRSSLLALVLIPLALAGCRKAHVAVYEIPKEHDDVPMAAMTNAPHPGMGAGDMASTAVQQASGEGLAWTAPADWRAKSGSSIRKGSYAVGPDGGAVADCSITAFPGDVGGDLANVNRWLAQLQQPPIDAAALGNMITALNVNGLEVRLVELTGGAPGDPQRMLSAIVPFEGATWFFKLTGPDETVKAEKQAFLTLVRSIHSSGPAASAAPAPAAAPTGNMADTTVQTAEGPGLRWTAPAAWQSEPASAMRKATYKVTGDDGAVGDMSVTAFPGDVGGELANVNRWRGQLQLAPLGAAELDAAVTRLNVDGLNITVVDFTGSDHRLLGAIVPYHNATWFFKLTGPAPLLEREKAGFLALIRSLKQS